MRLSEVRDRRARQVYVLFSGSLSQPVEDEVSALLVNVVRLPDDEQGTWVSVEDALRAWASAPCPPAPDVSGVRVSAKWRALLRDYRTHFRAAR